MNKGDILFVKPRGLIGRIISKITKSRFSHVAIYIGDNVIIESDVFIKTREIHLDQTDYFQQYEVMTAPWVTDEQREGIVDFAHKQLKTGYDYKQILAILIRLLTGIRLPFLDHKHRFICTELVYKAYLSVGIDLLPGFPNGDISPEELRWSKELYFNRGGFIDYGS